MADEETTLSVILRFLTDKGSVASAKKAIKEIQDQTRGIGPAGAGASGEKFRKEFAAVNKEVENFKKVFGVTTEEAATSLSGVRDGLEKTREEILEIIEAGNRMGLALEDSSDSVSDLEQSTSDAEKAAKDHELQIAAIRSQYIRLGRDAQRLNTVGITLGVIGAAISGPILLATRQAVQSLGMADATTREWLDSTGRIEAAQIRIGRVGAQALLPVMERVAELLERGAEFAEDNPDAVRNVLAVGGALVGIGGLASVVSRGIRIYADIKVLGAAALQNTAADKMLVAANIQAGAAATQTGGGFLSGLAGRIGGIGKTIGQGILSALTGTAGAVGGGIAAGFGINELLRNALGPQSGLASFGQFATVAASGVGGLISPEKGQEWALSIGRLTGAIDDLAESADKATERIIPEAAVSAFIQFRRQEVEAERQYSQQRNQIVEQFAQQRVQIEGQYEAQRNQLIEDFARSQALALEDFRIGQTRAARDFVQSQGESEKSYYDRRSKLAAQYQIDVQRAEEDHQRKLRKMREEHEARLEDLTDARDALGILKERENFERNRRDAEEEYQVEARRRSEDFARRVAEQEQQFAQERSQRFAQFAQRQADELADFQRRREREQEQQEERLKQLDEQQAAELSKLEANHKQELQLLDQNFREEQAKRRRAFADQLRDLGDALGFERDLRNQFYAAMAQDLQAWIAIWEGQVGSNLPGFPTAPGRQFGGYVRSGLYRLHDDEFVVNPQTTSALERMIGNRLTQNNIMAAVAGGGTRVSSSRMEIHVHQTGWRIEGGLTAREKEGFRQMARGEAEAGVLEALA